MTDPDTQRLDSALQSLGSRRIEAVDLEMAVISQLPPVAAPSRNRWRPAAVPVALATTLLLAGCMAIPPLRDYITSVFQADGIVVQRTPTPLVPAPSQRQTRRPPWFGDHVSWAAAQKHAGGKLMVSSRMGVPDEIFEKGSLFTFRWHAASQGGPAWTLMQVVGPSRPLIRKMIETGTHVRAVSVQGSSAIWVDGPQQLAYLPKDGPAQELPPTRFAHTLIWQRAGNSFRLEADVSLSRAMDVAGTFQ